MKKTDAIKSDNITGKAHEHELVRYENTRADLKTLLVAGEKIAPKAWGTEKEQFEKEMPVLRSEDVSRPCICGSDKLQQSQS